MPHELTDAQRQELTGDFARFLSDRYQVAVDTNIHAPNPDGDERNHHAHLLICTRPFDETKAHGLGNNLRDFDAVACQRDGKENPVELWRATWAQQLNDSLERASVRDSAGEGVAVDHRSYERQGIEQEPMIKEGSAVTGQKRRGEAPERAEQNNAIRARNAQQQWESEIQGAAQKIPTLEQKVLRQRQAQGLTAGQAHAQLLSGEPRPTEWGMQELTPKDGPPNSLSSNAGAEKHALSRSPDNTAPDEEKQRVADALARLQAGAPIPQTGPSLSSPGAIPEEPPPPDAPSLGM